MATTEAAVLSPAIRQSETRTVSLVCAAHFVSHYHMILLAPLFPMVRDDLGVSYTELGFALALFNIVGSVLQTPAGFLCDRIGARALLIGALVLSGAAYLMIGLVPLFWVLLLMFGIAGLANAVYHPADYAILSHLVPHKRIGRIYSFHNFAGIAGSAVAPPTILLIEGVFGWRGAFVAAGVLGFVAGLALLFYHDEQRPRASAVNAVASSPSEQGKSGWGLLLSLPILQNFAFFVLLTIISGGTTTYLIVGLAALYGTDSVIANLALTVSLVVNGAAVLLGGWLAGRTTRHAAVAVISLIGTAAMLVLVSVYNMAPVPLIVVFSIAGFFTGLMMPSRDMIVRSVTPPGEFGKVFGFVTTGFNVGGVFVPMLFGAMLDYGHPAGVFLLSAAGCLLAVFSVITIRRPGNAGTF